MKRIPIENVIVDDKELQLQSYKHSVGLEYEFNEIEKTYFVKSKGLCEDNEIVIPNMYKGYPITSISEKAFYYCKSLTNIVIPKSVTRIGMSVFDGCESLTIYCEATVKPSSWNSG